MSRRLIEKYARLLTSHASGCAELFTEDAVYHTQMAGQKLRLKGRDEIRRFISRVPKSYSFKITGCSFDGAEYKAECLITGPGVPAFRSGFRFKTHINRFKSFETGLRSG